MRFADRNEAGRRLGAALERYRQARPVVVGLPRGGVPVAARVADALGAPLDVIVVRKLGVPYHRELAMGAIGEGGVRVLNEAVIRHARVSNHDIERIEQEERVELARRAARFRKNAAAVPLAGRTVIVVDDGIATGATARAACQVARAHGAAKVVLAVPVAPPDWTEFIGEDADEFVCLATPEHFDAVGRHYVDFSPTTDDDVVQCLSSRPTPPATSFDREVTIPVGEVVLPGHLFIPDGAPGVVLFAHGSGSSRWSPRNQFVAAVLGEAGLGTLLFDLLTPAEERLRANVFDIELLAARLTAAIHWLGEQPTAKSLPIGCFGASTGAAAALWAASEPSSHIAAVVCRGGRTDLTGGRLAKVVAPTLMIVGSRDELVLGLNQRASTELHGEHELAVVPGATHLFEEAGTLAIAAGLARDWFMAHLRQPVPS